MQVLAVQRHQQVRKEAAAYPRVVLERGSPWKDIALPARTEYETLFDVHVDEAPGPRRLLGSIKVLQRGRPSVDLPREMTALPEDCCSIGQTIDYYAAVETLGDAASTALLRALRDVTRDESIAQSFEGDPGFQASLIRFSEARRIYFYRGRSLHRDPPPSAPLRLHFEANLPGFSGAEEDRHRLALEFQPEPGSIGRLAAIVGKNGTGKTSLIARLAASLWGMERPDKERLVLKGPPVGRVIAVSYNAFDAFERPPSNFPGGKESRPAMDNYIYCGLRDLDGEIRPTLLFQGLEEDLRGIGALGRFDAWLDMLQKTRIAEDEPALAEGAAANDIAGIAKAALLLGAGQKTALTVLTRILSSIRNGTFVLVDEPEINLHPGLLAGLLRTLHDWFERYDGYGLIATHSPIGLQEIPGRNIRVLRRVGSVPIVQPYASESFGQSLSEIVGEVFGLDEPEKNYAQVMRDLLARGMSPEEIESSFGRPLSFQARMALRAIARERGSRA